MTAVSVISSGNPRRWAAPAIPGLMALALIAHVFVLTSPVSTINAIMVLCGAALGFTAILLSTPAPAVKERPSGSILPFVRRDGDASADNERRAA